jgi:transcriptional regulator with XRE-family HTH domain
MSPLRIQLREARIARGFSQVKLAELADVRTATVNRIENNRVTAIDLTVLSKLSKALGIPAGMLLTEDPAADASASGKVRAPRKSRAKRRST